MNAIRARQHGFSLVELMVGVSLTMVIAVALLTLLTNVSRNNTELARTNSVIENGRFALQLLEADITHGGYWGGYTPAYDDITYSTAVTSSTTATAVAFPTAVPDPCIMDTTPAWTQPASWSATYAGQLVAMPVQVYSYGATGSSVPVCAGASGLRGPLVDSSGTSLVQDHTDILVVRHAAPCAATASYTDLDCSNTTGQAAFFQFSRCPSTDAAAWMFASDTSTLTLHKGSCGTNTADYYRMVSTIYWVRNYFTTPGDGIPTLVRTRYQLASGTLAHQSTETLIDGIQAFRVQLGVDSVSKPTAAGGSGNSLSTASFQAAPTFQSTSSTYTPTNRGDGNADKYIVCANPATASDPCYDTAYLSQSAFNLANTVSVKLYVLARAQSETPGYIDSKLYCLSGSCTIGSSNKTSCTGTGTNDYLTLYGPYCDKYKRHIYTQTARMNNVSMRREVPSTWP